MIAGLVRVMESLESHGILVRVMDNFSFGHGKCIKYVHLKIIHNIVDIDRKTYLHFSSELRTRGSHKFKLRVPHNTKDVFKYSFFPRTARDWNNLPPNIATIPTLDKFKEEVAKFV